MIVQPICHLFFAINVCSAPFVLQPVELDKTRPPLDETMSIWLDFCLIEVCPEATLDNVRNGG
jgi:hypothetical protein